MSDDDRELWDPATQGRSPEDTAAAARDGIARVWRRIWERPVPFYRELQRQAPVSWAEPINTWLVSRHEDVVALHVNYGLRGAESEADEAFCRALCARLGVELFVVHAAAPAGNVQAWARDVRYAEAERLAAEHDALIAVGHTATDQLETVLYRLAASPGRRALLGMPERSGRIVRPLLALTREQTAEYCRSHGLDWREDSSNAVSARGLIRSTILPALRQLHPAADANLLATLAQLRDEAELLDAAVDAALRDERELPEAPAPKVRGRELAALPPALARLVIQRLAGDEAPNLAAHADAIVALSRRPGTATLDLPGGLRAISEYGRVRIVPAFVSLESSASSSNSWNGRP